MQEVCTLARIARTEPQAAYSAFTHGLAGKWNYLTRVSPTFREFLVPLGSTIRTEYLASLTGRCISDLERRLLHLPPRLGGLAVCNSCLAAEHSFQSTSEQVKPVVDYNLDPESTTLEDALAAQSECVANARERLQNDHMLHAEDIFQALSQRGQREMELSQKRGASYWLTALPLASLSKGEFRDALCMRYGWRTFQHIALTVSHSRLNTFLAALAEAMSLFATPSWGIFLQNSSEKLARTFP